LIEFGIPLFIISSHMFIKLLPPQSLIITAANVINKRSSKSKHTQWHSKS